jgi:anti-sigma-K factor RskA
MLSRDHEQTGLIIDYCLGLCSPAEAQKAEESIACNGRAAAWHSQVQTALASLSYLPAEPCPDYLAELTVQRWRRLTVSGASAEGLRLRVLRSDPRAWFGRTAALTALAASIAISVSVLLSSLGSTSPDGLQRVPPEYFEKTSGNANLFDSNHAQLSLWDEWPVPEFMPQAPDPFSGASGSGGHYPPGKDRSIKPGPRVLPASSKRHVGPSS